MKHIIERHMESHGRLICGLDNMIEVVDDLPLDEESRRRLRGMLIHLGKLRADAEFLAMGEEWARYYMTENEWKPDVIEETCSRLFAPPEREPFDFATHPILGEAARRVISGFINQLDLEEKP